MDEQAQDPPEILLVEDNPHDIQLTMHAFQEHNLANRMHVARDGAEAHSLRWRGGHRNLGADPQRG